MENADSQEIERQAENTDAGTSTEQNGGMEQQESATPSAPPMEHESSNPEPSGGMHHSMGAAPSAHHTESFS
ncbi:hypothetical protein NEAUS03_1324 [Nematocida ausubeli]|nr:hypothetical protein NEAUS03_1324 [Nematocida ausubeli]